MYIDCKASEVYTDGACKRNGRSDARAGYGVWWGDGHVLYIWFFFVFFDIFIYFMIIKKRNTSSKLDVNEKHTNQRAELTAAITAIRQAISHNSGPLTLYTDSKYVINCATRWISRWKKNGWKDSNCNQIKNLDDIKKLHDLCNQNISIQWVYVKGHSGNYGNEQADKLAKKSIE